jgi:hypothetical protein
LVATVSSFCWPWVFRPELPTHFILIKSACLVGGDYRVRRSYTPLCVAKKEFCSRFLSSHGQRIFLVVGISARTAHDHRRLRGDRGFQVTADAIPARVSKVFYNDQRR